MWVHMKVCIRVCIYGMHMYMHVDIPTCNYAYLYLYIYVEVAIWSNLVCRLLLMLRAQLVVGVGPRLLCLRIATGGSANLWDDFGGF